MSNFYLEEAASVANLIKEIELPDTISLSALKEGDYVYLSFRNDKMGEQMWVKITGKDNKGMFEGELLNEPVVMKNVLMHEKIMFEIRHILNFSTTEEQQRIIKEYEERGVVPNQKNTFESVKILIEKLINLAETDSIPKNKRLFKIAKKDRAFFREDIASLIEEKDEHEALHGIYRLFLSIVFMFVIPQTLYNLENDFYDVGPESETYYQKYEMLLKEVLRIYEIVATTHLELLEQLRQLNPDEELQNLSIEDLPDFFGSFIDETLLAVQSLE
ncbi:MAG TPA: hypothetical protein VF828_04175 [Patescibacteria group bacterium]